MRRRLSEADRRAWEEYRRTADPLAGVARPRPADPSRPDGPAPAPALAPPSAPTPFRLGERARARGSTHDLAPALPERLGAEPVAMDARAFHRLRAGKLRPEAKLDLHGLTLEAAHPRLVGFVADAHARGRRLLLVVTGKGKRRDDGGPIPTRLGVLRQQVPQWLRMPPLAPLVLQVAPAHRSHGGEGAYYVYLRRAR